MVIRIASSLMLSSSAAPNLHSTSGCAFWLTIRIISLNSDIFRQPGAVVMFTNTPRAPSKVTLSKSGLEIAWSVAKRARSIPCAKPEPIMAIPRLLITVFTSAKSKLIMSLGQVTTSEIPATASRSTLSAARKASRMVTSSPKAVINLSFGIIIRESTRSLS